MTRFGNAKGRAQEGVEYEDSDTESYADLYREIKFAVIQHRRVAAKLAIYMSMISAPESAAGDLQLQF